MGSSDLREWLKELSDLRDVMAEGLEKMVGPLRQAREGMVNSSLLQELRAVREQLDDVYALLREKMIEGIERYEHVLENRGDKESDGGRPIGF